MSDQQAASEQPMRGAFHHRDVPPWFARLAKLGWGFLGIVGGAAVVVLGLAALRELVVPLVLAAVFAVVFEPAVSWLADRRFPRSVGAVVMILVTAALIWGSLAVVVVGLADQADELTARFDEAEQAVKGLVGQADVARFVDRVRASADAAGSTLRDGVASAQGVFIGVVLAIMGGPLAGSVGIVNVIGAYIPFLGAFIGGAFAVLMALSGGGGWLAVGALAVVVFANVVLENVLEPRFLGASLNMHPVVVLLSTVAGGAAVGIPGLVLAAPLTSIGINLYHELEDSGFFDDDRT